MPQSVVGDELLVRVDKEKKRYIIGSLAEIIRPAATRRQPPCPHYDECGGCDLLQLSDDDQFSLKREMLVQTLVGSRINVPVQMMAAPDSCSYRHRAVFHCQRDSRQVGFLRRRTHEIVDVPDCLVLASGLKELLRRFAETPTLLPSGIDSCYTLANSSGGFAAMGCRGRFNPRNLKPLKNVPATVVENYGFGDLELAAAGFAQVNPQITRMMIKDLLSHCAGAVEIAELYGGSGTFSLPLATVAKKLRVYESDLSAAERGRRNAARNGLGNVSFISGRVEKRELTTPLDTLVVDPPRVGLTAEVVEMIVKSPAQRIIYISCNPATLARDLTRLQEHSKNLTVDSIKAYDMYPGTTHLEVMAVLSRTS